MLPRGDPIVPVAVTLSAGVDPATGGIPPPTSLPQAARHQSTQELAFRPPSAVRDSDGPPRVATEAAGVFRPANQSFPYQQLPTDSQSRSQAEDPWARAARADDEESLVQLQRPRRQQNLANIDGRPLDQESERGTPYRDSRGVMIDEPASDPPSPSEHSSSSESPLLSANHAQVSPVPPPVVDIFDRGGGEAQDGAETQ